MVTNPEEGYKLLRSLEASTTFCNKLFGRWKCGFHLMELRSLMLAVVKRSPERY
jgi:hypothetical protein